MNGWRIAPFVQCYTARTVKKLTQVSQVSPTRPERAEAPSPGRALKKSPFLRTKTEKCYDL